MPEPRQISIAYDAARVGAPSDMLTLGQQFIWSVISELAPHDEHLNLAVTAEIGGHDRQFALEKLSLFVERHESLRTFYRLASDGSPRQILREQGELVIDLVTCLAEERELVLRDTRARLVADRFDLMAAPPVRAAIIEVDGVPGYVVLAFSHMVADGVGRANLLRELREIFSSAGSGREAGRPWQPQDQAVWEQSAEGLAVQNKARGYWQSILPLFPESMFRPISRQPEKPRWRVAALRSDEIGVAARELARRHRVSPASVLITAFALLLACRSGLNHCAMMLHAANRFGGDDAETTFKSVGTFVQPVPLRVELACDGFGEMARKVHAAASDAYALATLCPSAVEDLIEGIAREHGQRIELDTTVNVLPDLAGRQVSVAEHEEAVKRMLDSRASPAFTWETPLLREIPKFLAYVELPDYISLLGDTAYFRADEFEPFLRTLHGFLIETVRREENPWPVLSGP